MKKPETPTLPSRELAAKTIIQLDILTDGLPRVVRWPLMAAGLFRKPALELARRVLHEAADPPGPASAPIDNTEAARLKRALAVWQDEARIALGLSSTATVDPGDMPRAMKEIEQEKLALAHELARVKRELVAMAAKVTPPPSIPRSAPTMEFSVPTGCNYETEGGTACGAVAVDEGRCAAHPH